MMKPLHLFQLTRAMGLPWLAFRLRYALRLRSGSLRRRLPAVAWSEIPPGHFLQDPSLADAERYLAYRRHQAPAFFFNPTHQQLYRPYFTSWDQHADAVVTPVTRADQVASGVLRYFEHVAGEVGYPPHWHVNPFTGQQAPADRHWSQIGDFGYGDIKIIWEASRFGFVFAFVRAYWRSGDESYARLFWQVVEDWHQHNPPQLGPHWKCGQEITFRVMAWCFGLYGFLHSAETTAERVAMLGHMIALSGQRIAANIDYALSQRNNHGISEGVGLWTIGLLFPELRHAAPWRERGRAVLEAQGQTLLYEDGAFAQHSVNYHRLMLHDYLWALRLGEVHQVPFSTALRARVAQASELLYQMQDEQSGRVPYYGENDGALILPLNNCDYLDFRPIVQSIAYLSSRQPRFAPGPWDEDLLWLFGPTALTAIPQVKTRADYTAPVGGYYTLRSPTSLLFTRCASFRHRPGQADMLHVDLWWQGHNIAVDAGTYSYNAAPPWNNSLARTEVHNTVTVDGLDQMERVSTFLWLPWLHSQVQQHKYSPGGWFTYWQGTHDGYQRCQPPVCHRRGILRLGNHHWLVLDVLNSAGTHRYRLHWLFPDIAYQWQEDSGSLTLSLPNGSYHVQCSSLVGQGTYTLIRADPHSHRGWRAPYYSYREPALSFAMTQEADTVCFWTVFGPEKCQVEIDAAMFHMTTTCWQAHVKLQPEQDGSFLAHACVSGAFADFLQVL